MSYTKDFSIIVPCWRGAAHFLPKLFDSIPSKEGIEIIVVDNSNNILKREEIASNREIILLHSAPDRHAGGSRNDGLLAARGKWILFADADDYFSHDAFDIFYSHFNSDAEIIYTKPEGIYVDTGERSDRGDNYINLVHGFCTGMVDEEELRLTFGTPWCKMISQNLIKREKLRFDEIRACNDIYFSLTSGYYARSIEVDDRTTYYVTVNRGSLTQHRDKDVLLARLTGKLHCNKFLKEHGLGHRQHSIMYFLAESRHLGIGTFIKMIYMIVQAKQNPFVGWSRWFKTAGKVRKIEEKNKKYIIR